MKRIKKIICIPMILALLFVNNCMIYAAAPDNTHYLKSDYLQIVDEINAQYGSSITLTFFNDGDYVDSSDIPSPQEYKEQLQSMMESQKLVQASISEAQSEAIPDQLDGIMSRASGSATAFNNYANITIGYSTTYSGGRYYFNACNSVSFSRNAAWPEYTFTPLDRGHSLIDAARTISAWGRGSLLYLTSTYSQVIENWNVSAEFYCSASGGISHN